MHEKQQETFPILGKKWRKSKQMVIVLFLSLLKIQNEKAKGNVYSVT